MNAMNGRRNRRKMMARLDGIRARREEGKQRLAMLKDCMPHATTDQAYREIWMPLLDDIALLLGEVERLLHGYDIFTSILYDYDGYDMGNADQMRGLVDDIYDLSIQTLRGEPMTVTLGASELDQDMAKYTRQEQEIERLRAELTDDKRTNYVKFIRQQERADKLEAENAALRHDMQFLAGFREPCLICKYRTEKQEGYCPRNKKPFCWEWCGIQEESEG
jgi:hypothetical protein